MILPIYDWIIRKGYVMDLRIDNHKIRDINYTEETARMKNDLGLRLKRAWDQGELYAACLRPGLIFLGAGPAAESKGYAPGTPEYRMFLGAALDILQHKRVVIDEHHRIVEIGAKQ